MSSPEVKIHIFNNFSLGQFFPKNLGVEKGLFRFVSLYAIIYLGFTGMIGTISKAIGLLLSGWAISRWKFSARFLSGWNVILGLMYFTSLIVFSNVGCPSTPLPIREISECNQGCGCSMDSRIQPICTKDGFTSYYSPCLAGCTESTYNKTSRYTLHSVENYKVFCHLKDFT